jgi:hypothetical protein
VSEIASVVPIPTALMAHDERVSKLCAAVAHGKSARPLVDAYEVDGTVRIFVGDLELQVDPEEALGFSNTIATAAGDAIAKRRRP